MEWLMAWAINLVPQRIKSVIQPISATSPGFNPSGYPTPSAGQLDRTARTHGMQGCSSLACHYVGFAYEDRHGPTWIWRQFWDDWRTATHNLLLTSSYTEPDADNISWEKGDSLSRAPLPPSPTVSPVIKANIPLWQTRGSSCGKQMPGLSKFTQPAYLRADHVCSTPKHTIQRLSNLATGKTFAII